MADCPSLQCFYSVLGVQKDSSSTEIRTAYRKLAMKWHPDRCSQEKAEAQEQAKRKFQKVQEAYAVLSDDAQRLLYDTGIYGATEQHFSNESLVRDFEELQKLFMSVVDTGTRCKRASRVLNVPGCTESDPIRNKKTQSPQPSPSSSSTTPRNFSCNSSTASRQQSANAAELPFTCGSPKPHANLYQEPFCGEYECPSPFFDTSDDNFIGDTILYDCQHNSPTSSRHGKLYTQEYPEECYTTRNDLSSFNNPAQPMTQCSSSPAPPVVSSSRPAQAQPAKLKSEGFCIGAGGNCPLAGKQSRTRRKKATKER